MTEAQLINDFALLPPALKEDVAEYISFLKYKYRAKEKAMPVPPPNEVRTPGLGKGLVQIGDHFDEPIHFYEECL